MFGHKKNPAEGKAVDGWKKLPEDMASRAGKKTRTGKGELVWDPATEEPVVKKSICTGEATVGFVNRATGRYRDIRKVTTPTEIESFCREVGIEDGKIKTIY